MIWFPNTPVPEGSISECLNFLTFICLILNASVPERCFLMPGFFGKKKQLSGSRMPWVPYAPFPNALIFLTNFTLIFNAMVPECSVSECPDFLKKILPSFGTLWFLNALVPVHSVSECPDLAYNISKREVSSFHSGTATN